MNIREFYGSDNLQGTYLLVGEEAYLKENALTHVVGKYTSPSEGGLNVTKLRGESVSPVEIMDQAQVLPFFAEHRIIIVKDVVESVKGISSDHNFYKEMHELPESNILLLVEGENQLKKTQKLYKELNQRDRVLTLDRLKGNEFRSFIEKYLRRENLTMEYDALQFFIDKTKYLPYGSTQTLLHVTTELDKIMVLAEGTITRDLVAEVMEDVSSDRVFDLIDAMGQGDLTKVMEMKSELLRREEPVARILSLIQRQVRLLMGYILLREEGAEDRKIKGELSIHSDFILKKLARQAQGYSFEVLKEQYGMLLETEYKLKTTPSDEEVALDLLLLKMSNKKS